MIPCIWQGDQQAFSIVDWIWLFLSMCAFLGICHFFSLAIFSLSFELETQKKFRLLICIFSCPSQSQFSRQLWYCQCFTRWIILEHNLPTRQGILQPRCFSCSREVFWLYRDLLQFPIGVFLVFFDMFLALLFYLNVIIVKIKESIQNIN